MTQVAKSGASNFWINSLIEVKLTDPDNYRIIREILTRIGVPDHKNKTLYQTAHIYDHCGRTFIVHFKQLFARDGRPSYMSLSDFDRLVKIVQLLCQWGLITVENPLINPDIKVQGIFVLNKDIANEWNLVPKYVLEPGVVKNFEDE